MIYSTCSDTISFIKGIDIFDTIELMLGSSTLSLNNSILCVNSVIGVEYVILLESISADRANVPIPIEISDNTMIELFSIIGSFSVKDVPSLRFVSFI